MGNFKTFYKQYIKIVEKLTYSKNKNTNMRMSFSNQRVTSKKSNHKPTHSQISMPKSLVCVCGVNVGKGSRGVFKFHHVKIIHGQINSNTWIGEYTDKDMGRQRRS